METSLRSCLGWLAQSDALSSILDMHGIGKPSCVVKSADHQAASACAVRLELNSMEQQSISDPTTRKNNIFAGSQFLGFIDLVNISNAHLIEAGNVAFLGVIGPLTGLSNGGVIHQLALKVTTESTHCGS